MFLETAWLDDRMAGRGVLEGGTLEGEEVDPWDFFPWSPYSSSANGRMPCHVTKE